MGKSVIQAFRVSGLNKNENNLQINDMESNWISFERGFGVTKRHKNVTNMKYMPST